MTLLGWPTDPSQRLSLIAGDLAIGDGPRLADQLASQSTVVDLITQRGRRHPESGCRLSEGEHLLDGVAGAMLARLAATDVARGALGVLVAPLARDADRALHLGDEVGREAGLAKDGLALVVHVVPLDAAVDMSNLDGSVYVVKRFRQKVIHNLSEAA